MAILSISTEFGTGALEIGQELKSRLGYEYVTLGRLFDEARQVAGQMNLDVAKDRAASIDIWGGNDLISFMAAVQGVIFEHAVKDNAIILSRGSNYLFKGIPHALGIRIFAPLEYRIGHVMKNQKVNRETARLLVQQADREIDCTIYHVYGKDWDDPEAYEIKFDTSIQKPGDIIEAVENLLKHKDTLKTEEAQNLLRMRALASKIKAKVVAHPGFYASTLELEIQGNGILLRGAVRGEAEQREIEKEALVITGDVPLICELNCLALSSKKGN